MFYVACQTDKRFKRRSHKWIYTRLALKLATHLPLYIYITRLDTIHYFYKQDKHANYPSCFVIILSSLTQNTRISDRYSGNVIYLHT